MADVDTVATVVVSTIAKALAPVHARLAQLDARLATDVSLAVARELAPVRERLAVLETRAPVPGPPGRDGKDGADGFGLDDFSADFDGDRTIVLSFARPGRDAKRFPLTLPFQKFQGVYQIGRTYVTGDTVSYGGSSWHCHAPMTTGRPGDSSDWQLAVKRGQDGKDVRHG